MVPIMSQTSNLKRLVSKARRKYWRLTNALAHSARSDHRFPADFSDSEVSILHGVRPFTLTTPERIVSLVRAIDYLVTCGVEGDIVECGVWKGGSMMAAALSLMAKGDATRTLHLFDTFEGMPPPTEVDRDFKGNSAAAQLQQQTQDAPIWARALYEEVAQNVASTGYPLERLRMIKGLVEDTIPREAPDHIALLRLDTDWYASTRHELEHLFPRLVPGGVLILDDYGEWQGARLAVDEYMARNRLPLLLCRVDMGARIAVKQLHVA